MKTKHIVQLIVAVCLVLVLVSREMGIVNLNAGNISMNVSQSVSLSSSRGEADEPVSYDIVLTRDGNTWMEHRRIILQAPRVSIRGELKDIEYSGMDWMPLHKSMTMTYRCDFSTVEGDGAHSVNGTIEGEVQSRFGGLFSRREARRQTLEAAKKQIREYMMKMNP